MLKIHELREIIKMIDESGIQEFELEQEEMKLVLKKQGEQIIQTIAPAIAQAQAPIPTTPVEDRVQAPQVQGEEKGASKDIEKQLEDKNLHPIKSPMVGTFYAAPAPDADPYVKVGDTITEKSVVCIVEAMKLFNEIEAEVNGEIVEILVENGQLVEYGQPLFFVKVR